MDVKLGVALHWTDNLSYDGLIDLIHEIENLGYEQIWVSNEKFYWDMNSVATVVAQNTHKVKIGTFVSDPFSVHPALTAMFIGTLDKISGGRAILGLGAGGTGFPVMGIKRTKPAQAIKEAVTVIRGLLHGETVDLQGQVIQCNRGHLHVTPRPDIPIIVATRGNQVLRVGGEVGDGVMISTYAKPTGIQYALSEIAKGAEGAHRKLEDLTIISRVDVCISENRREAIDAVKSMLGISLWTSYPDRTFVHCVGLEVPDELEQVIAKRDYNLMALNTHLIPDEFVEKFCWAGTAEEVAKKVTEVVRMGINQITFLPHPPAGGTVHETIRAFVQVVMPLVSEMVAS